MTESNNPIQSANLGVLVLAAGASTRMGYPKVIAKIGSQTFLEKALAAYMAGLTPSTMAIVGGAHIQTVRREASRHNLKILFNPDWEQGMFSSVQVGCRHFSKYPISGLFIHPVDCPVVSHHTLSRMAKTFCDNPNQPLLPVQGAQTGHPVLLPMSTVNAVAHSPNTATLRDFLQGPNINFCKVPDPGILTNFNSPENISIWLQGNKQK